MIGKFAIAAALLLLTVLPGVQGAAQSSPAGQPPATAEPAPPQTAAQQPPEKPPAGQEPAEEQPPARKAKPRDYKNWVFNVGAGANLDGGTTKTFVRGGGLVVAAGAARNANKYLGLRGDFIFANLPLRDSAQELAQTTGANNRLFAVTLDPIINISVTKLYGAYVLIGPGFYHRSGKLDNSTAVPGSACNAFWTWWGACSNVSIPLSNSFLSSSQNEFGYNFGGGVTRKFPSGVEIYGELRFMHGAHNNITTDVRPITLGLRW